MKLKFPGRGIALAVAFCLSLGLAMLLADGAARPFLAFAALTALALALWGWGVRAAWRALRSRRYGHSLSLLASLW